jgi:WD40 repeat protein
MNSRLAVLILLLATSPLIAQTDPQAILTAYRADRVEAAKQFPVERLAAADAVAARAEAAIKTNPTLAARLARDARWQLPYAPPGLPAHVERVLGGCRLRHSDRVNALCYSPDGKTLATASRDGSVKLWDLASGRELASYRGLAELGPANPQEVKDDVLRASAIAWSSKNVIACGGYGEIHLLDPATLKVNKVFKGHTNTVRAIAFRPDGLRLASIGDDKTIRIWDMDKGVEALKIEPAKAGGNPAANLVGRFEAISYAPKSDQIAVVNQDGKLAIYDVSGKEAKLKMAASVVGQAGTVYTVKYTPDGTGLYTGGETSSPPRLTAAPAQDAPPANPMAGAAPAVRSFPGHTDRVNTLDVTPDGTLLVTGSGSSGTSSDTTCRVWEANTGKSLKVFAAHATEITTLAIRPDGKEVASADDAGIVRVWPLGAVDEHSISAEATDILWAVAVSPSGAKYAAAGADKFIRVYETATGSLLQTLRGHKSAITSLAFLDEDSLASAGGDRTPYLWNLKADGTPRPLTGHKSVVLAVAAAEGGRKLLTGSVDRTLKLWDVATGKVLGSYDAKSVVCAIAAKKDSPRVVIGTADGWIAMLEATESGIKLISTTGAHTSGVAGVALRPDGREIASVGGDGSVRAWTIGDKNALTIRLNFDPIANPGGNGPYPLSCVSYSNDGKLFAVGGQEGLIRITDVNTGREARTLRGHSDWISSIAFGQDNKSVISAGVDKAVRRFPLGESDIAPVPGHARAAGCVAVSPDGKSAVTVAAEEIKHWDLVAGKEIASLPFTNSKPNSVSFAGPNTIVIGGEGQKLQWYDLASGKLTKSEPAGRSIYSLIASGPDAVGVWQVKLDATELITYRNGKFSESFLLPGSDKGEKSIVCAAITPDANAAIAAQENQNVMLIDLVTRKQIGGDWPLFDARPVDVALSPDRSTVACIDEKGTIKVAKVEGRSVTATAKAHPKGCNGLIMARSGDRFATIGTDSEIKAWDLAAKELRSWTLPVDIKAATFSPDGRKIVTANGDGSAYVLTVP